MIITEPEIINHNNQIRALFESYGSNSLAFSTLAPGLNYFELPDIGYVAYVRIRGRDIVLSDPIVAPANLNKICEAFLEFSDRPLFVHIREATATVLNDLGYRTNLMGYESYIDIENFKPTWGSHNGLKESIRRFNRDNYVVVESSIENLKSLGVTIDDLKQISTKWLKSRRHHKELSFLIRPLEYKDQTGTRFFFLFQKDKLFGFTTFDPVYSDGEVIAYCPNHARYLDNLLPTGRSFFVNMIAIEKFQRESIKELALGLSPLAGDLKTDLSDSSLLRFLFLIAHKRSGRIGFEGLSKHKEQYKGRKELIYYASARNGLSMLRELVELLRVSNVF